MRTTKDVLDVEARLVLDTQTRYDYPTGDPTLIAAELLYPDTGGTAIILVGQTVYQQIGLTYTAQHPDSATIFLAAGAESSQGVTQITTAGQAWPTLGSGDAMAFYYAIPSEDISTGRVTIEFTVQWSGGGTTDPAIVINPSNSRSLKRS